VKLVLVLNDGTEVESSFSPPYSVREQVNFEEHHKLSFVTVYNSMDAMAAAEGDASALDDSKSFKVGWILWFGWMRARPKVAARFDTFLDTLADWRVEEEESDRVALAESEDAEPAAASGLDPTQPAKKKTKRSTSTGAKSKETGLRSVAAG
jgi:hypothetical protein